MCKLIPCRIKSLLKNIYNLNGIILIFFNYTVHYINKHNGWGLIFFVHVQVSRYEERVELTLEKGAV